MGFDICGRFGFDDTERFLVKVKPKDREVWIAEAWSTIGDARFDPSRSTLDVRWIRVLYYFAIGIML